VNKPVIDIGLRRATTINTHRRGIIGNTLDCREKDPGSITGTGRKKVIKISDEQ